MFYVVSIPIFTEPTLFLLRLSLPPSYLKEMHHRRPLRAAIPLLQGEWKPFGIDVHRWAVEKGLWRWAGGFFPFKTQVLPHP